MPITETLPRRLAVELLSTLDALRAETAALRAAGLLTVTVDELLDAAEGTQGWLADLAAALEATAGDLLTPVPQRGPWARMHVVYAVSAILVWAEGLRRDGRLVTSIGLEALAAWDRVEHLAGLGGRTAGAVGVEPETLRRMAEAGPVVTISWWPTEIPRADHALLSVA